MGIKNINKVANSFKTYDDLFSSLEKGDYSVLSRECGTNNYPIINWMIDFFLEKEEYHKCNFLSKLRLPEPSKERLDKEIRWLTTKNMEIWKYQ
jgi:hypothetical protein